MGSKQVLIVGLTFFTFFLLFNILKITTEFLDYNKWTIAHNLITAKIWYSEGITKHNFNPIYTFGNEGDKNINNLGGIKDNQDRYYYVSYPPFSFYLPFILFQIFKIKINLQPILYLNLVLQIASAILLATIISILTLKSYRTWFPTLMAFVFYLYSGGNNWFYKNIYFADILAQTLFLLLIYLALKIIIERNFQPKLLLFFAIINFFLVYTEWIGVFFSVALLSLAMIKTKSDRDYIKLILPVIVPLFMALLLTFVQYAAISGWQNLIIAWIAKLAERSSFGNLPLVSLKPYLNIAYFLKTFYFWELLILLLLVLYLWKKLGNKILTTHEYYFFYLLILPIFLHYLIFFDFNSHHSFSLIKISPVIIAGLTLALTKIIGRRKVKKISICYLPIILIFCITSIFWYYQLKGKLIQKTVDYENVGKQIKTSARTNQVVFLCGLPDNFVIPQLIFYAERNVIACLSKSEAEKTIAEKRIDEVVINQLIGLNSIKIIER